MTSYPTEVAVFAECELCEGVGDVILNLNARVVLVRPLAARAAAVGAVLEELALPNAIKEGLHRL